MNHRVSRIAFVVGVFVAFSGAWAEPWRFAVVPDTQGDPANDHSTNETFLPGLAQEIIAQQAEVVIVVGDLVVDRQLEGMLKWIELFKEPLEAHGIKVYPCRGNHDMNDDNWNAAFTGAHALPNNGPADEKNMTYSVEHQNAMFVALETMHYGDPNLTWLTGQLEQSNQIHTFVFGHYPATILAYTKAEFDAHNYRLGADFWSVLGSHGVQTYFCGHWHDYVYASGYSPQGNPMQHIIAGSFTEEEGPDVPAAVWGFPAWANLQKGFAIRQQGYMLLEVDGVDVTGVYKKRVSANSYEAYPESVFSFRQPGWAPECALTVDTTSAADPLEVVFTDNSTPGAAPITSWLWDFGDGQTSTEQNPTHTYAEEGTYVVTLTVANQYDSTTESSVFYTEGTDVPLADVAGPLVVALLLAGVCLLRKRQACCR